MTEPGEASLKVAKASLGGCKPQRPSERLDRHAVRGALYGPPEPGLPYIAIVLNAQDEVLSAQSAPSAEAGNNLVAKVSAAFASARSCVEANEEN
jgi:hypothetical protein